MKIYGQLRHGQDIARAGVPNPLGAQGRELPFHIRHGELREAPGQHHPVQVLRQGAGQVGQAGPRGPPSHVRAFGADKGRALHGGDRPPGRRHNRPGQGAGDQAPGDGLHHVGVLTSEQRPRRSGTSYSS